MNYKVLVVSEENYNVFLLEGYILNYIQVCPFFPGPKFLVNLTRHQNTLFDLNKEASVIPDAIFSSSSKLMNIFITSNRTIYIINSCFNL